MDRPLGSTHPTYGYPYPINYGYVPGTISGDGEDLDAYVLGVTVPVASYHGRCVAVIHRTSDDDDKLVVIPHDLPVPSDSEIRAATHFQEQYFESVILRESSVADANTD